MERFFSLVALAAAAHAGAPVQSDAGPPQYRAVILPQVTENDVYADSCAAINDFGVAVGYEWIGAPSSGMVWRRGGVELLAPPPEPALNHTWPRAINNRGTVVGGIVEQGGWPPQEFPVIWRDGEAAFLEIWTGADGGLALDINQGGTIVGYTIEEWPSGSEWYRHVPTVWGPDLVPQRLPWLAGWQKQYQPDVHAEAQFINDAGVIAGTVETVASRRPVVWHPDGSIEVLSLPAGYSLHELRAFNKHGHLLAQGFPQGTGWAGLLWRGQDPIVLPLEQNWGHAQSMNDSGMIVTGASGPVPDARLFDGTRWYAVNDLIVDRGRERFICVTPVHINNEDVIFGVAWLWPGLRFAPAMLVPIKD